MVNSAETKWTPGPWKVDFSHPNNLPGGISQAARSRRSITRFNAFSRPTTAEALANAHLFAAAPDLYESLADTLALAELKYGNSNATAVECFTQARAALAKARGEA
jgi:hypothetical protein